jgi:hypothetical protein
VGGRGGGGGGVGGRGGGGGGGGARGEEVTPGGRGATAAGSCPRARTKGLTATDSQLSGFPFATNGGVGCSNDVRVTWPCSSRSAELRVRRGGMVG